jgi:hypothetical protein
MPVFNIDLEDGKKPVSFSLSSSDAKRFMDFMAETQQIKESGAAVKFDLIAHLYRQREFSLKTFGPGPLTNRLIDHIMKEFIEIMADPLDLKEWVDVIILGMDGAYRTGATPEQVAYELSGKQSRNESRTWPDWRTADPDKAMEHISEDPAYKIG